MLRTPRMVILIFSLCMICLGCYQAVEEKGVLNQWRDTSLPTIERGKTTETQILELLGPPSQVINLGDDIVFYYMMEKTDEKGGFLLVYNWKNTKTRYDRAIFFFDKNRLLKHYALSKENFKNEDIH